MKPIARDRIRRIQRRLLGWYDEHQRDLPWRRSRSAYAVWVSEIMLQQTRVEAVRGYYRGFLRRFGTVRKLARADLDDVMKAWEGMGYYARARNLHKAARKVVDAFGGKLPRTARELRTLPGIGRYTAGAIASIAFGLDEPVLDGNVTRVLCRVFRVRRSPKTATTQTLLWSLARQLIPPGQAGLFNQALMDLGAVVCIPARPRCDVCPLRRLCNAKRHGEQDKLPRKTKPKPLPHYTVVAGVIFKGDRILIDRRRADDLLGGLWEFAGGKVQPGETLPEALAREVREELNVRVEVGRRLVTVRHAYSHFRITLYALECRYLSGRPKAVKCAAWKWVRVGELGRYAFPKANHKIIEALQTGAITPPAK